MTPDARYAVNMLYLQKYDSALWEKLPSFSMTNIEYLPANEHGLYGQIWEVTTQKWVALCASSDPLNEAKQNVQALYDESMCVLPGLGFGLGYIPMEMVARLKPHQTLIIYEPSIAIFRAALYAIDISRVLNKEKHLQLFLGDDGCLPSEAWWLAHISSCREPIAVPFRHGYTQHYHKETYHAYLEHIVQMMRHHATVWKGQCPWE